MKIKFESTKAFTVFELALVICALAMLVAVILPLFARARSRSPRIQCVNNLKSIGIAYRIWQGDNGERAPAQIGNRETNGGWADFALLTNAGRFCWSNYCVLQNELGQTPRVLICPADKLNPATDFRHFKNENISYFFGTGADADFPQSIQGGDRNLAPGLEPKNDFGYSPDDGKGSDIILLTNASVCWSRKMHSAGRTEGAGNVLLGDSSVSQETSARFRSDIQPNAVDSGNFPTGYIKHSNSFRLIFP